MIWRIRVPAVVLALLVVLVGARSPATWVGESAVTGAALEGEPVPAAAAGAPGWRLRARVWTRDGWSRTLPIRDALARARDRAWRRGRAGMRVVRVKTPTLFAGEASYYGWELAGNTTACGEVFDPMAMTAAHPSLPCGTWLVVRYSGRDVVVRVNDRGPFCCGRVLDLSLGAFEALVGGTGPGVVFVEVRRP